MNRGARHLPIRRYGVSGAAFVNTFHASALPLPRIIVTTAAYYFPSRLTADQRFIGISSNGLLLFQCERTSGESFAS
jgi:hypothetical protein